MLEHEIRVSWGHCDPARIAYTGWLPWFALEAINAWLEAYLGGGWYEQELDHNLGLPFVDMHMSFRAPVTPRHRLVCKVWPTELGETSVRFRVEGRQDDTLCFTGDFVNVFVDPGAFSKRPPPEDVRKIIAGHLRDVAG